MEPGAPCLSAVSTLSHSLFSAILPRHPLCISGWLDVWGGDWLWRPTRGEKFHVQKSKRQLGRLEFCAERCASSLMHVLHIIGRARCLTFRDPDLHRPPALHLSIPPSAPLISDICSCLHCLHIALCSHPARTALAGGFISALRCPRLVPDAMAYRVAMPCSIRCTYCRLYLVDNI